MVHWEGRGKYPPEQERQRQRMVKEAEAREAFIQNVLQPIKDKLDLYGERSLTAQERVIVDERRAFFFPGEG